LVKYVRTGGDQYKSVVTDFKALNPFQVPSWGPIDSPDGKQLIAFVHLAVSAEAHHELLQYLGTHPGIWIGTFREVMDYVSGRPQESTTQQSAISH
ncbi:MAG TPA: hypothetical protein VIT67_16450, partial [Povalibacter sp.]